MFPTPSGRKTFVVTCKKCRRDVPSGRAEFPFQSIAVACPLCGELRRYLPSDVFLGRPDGRDSTAQNIKALRSLASEPSCLWVRASYTAAETAT